MKGHIINLKMSDRALILEALAVSMEYKYKKLRNPESIKLMEDNYEKFAEDIANYPVEIHDRTNNPMTWFQDQLKHSGLFWDTKLCSQANDLANRVINNTYEQYSRIERFEDLFKEK